jgi:hypothetical protein
MLIFLLSLMICLAFQFVGASSLLQSVTIVMIVGFGFGPEKGTTEKNEVTGDSICNLKYSHESSEKTQKAFSTDPT